MEGKNTTKVSLELPTEVLEFVKAGAAFSGTTKEQILQAWIAERYQQMNAGEDATETKPEASKPSRIKSISKREAGSSRKLYIRKDDAGTEYEAVEVPVPENFAALDASVADWLEEVFGFWASKRIENVDIAPKQYEILEHRLTTTLGEYMELHCRVRSFTEDKEAPEELVKKVLLEANSGHMTLVSNLSQTKNEEDFTHAKADAWIRNIAKRIGHIERSIGRVFYEKSHKALWTAPTEALTEEQTQLHHTYKNLADMFIGEGGKKAFDLARNAKTLQEAIAAVDHVLVLVEKQPTSGLFDVVLEMITTLNRRMLDAGKIKGKEGEKYKNLMGKIREDVGGARLAYENSEEIREKYRAAQNHVGGWEGFRKLDRDDPAFIEHQAIQKSVREARALLNKGVRRMGESISNLQHLVLAMQEGEVHEDTALKDIPDIINENKLSKGKVTKNALSALYAEYGKTPKEIDEFLRWDVEIPALVAGITTTTDSPVAKRQGKEVWTKANPAFLFEYTPGGPAEAGRAQSGSVQLNPVWNKLDPEYLETRHCYHSLKALAQFWYAGNITVKEAGFLCIPPTQYEPSEREQKYLLDYVRLDEVRFHGGTEEQKKGRAYQLMKLIGNVCKNEGWHTPLFFPALPDPLWEERSDGGIPEHRYLRIIWHPDAMGLHNEQLKKVLGEEDRYVEAPIYQLIGEDCPDRPAGWPNPEAVREIEEGISEAVDIAVERDRFGEANKGK